MVCCPLLEDFSRHLMELLTGPPTIGGCNSPQVTREGLRAKLDLNMPHGSCLQKCRTRIKN